MKRTLIILTGALIMLVGAYMVVAAESKVETGPTLLAHRWPGRPAWGEWPMRWRGPHCGPLGACPLHGAMMRTMMGKHIVPTQDGGAIVMIGCQLFKYDKDLKQVAHTEVKIDMEAMQKKMQKMMENCPMYRQMMEEREDDDNDKDDDDK